MWLGSLLKRIFLGWDYTSQRLFFPQCFSQFDCVPSQNKILVLCPLALRISSFFMPNAVLCQSKNKSGFWSGGLFFYSNTLSRCDESRTAVIQMVERSSRDRKVPGWIPDPWARHEHMNGHRADGTACVRTGEPPYRSSNLLLVVNNVEKKTVYKYLTFCI